MTKRQGTCLLVAALVGCGGEKPPAVAPAPPPEKPVATHEHTQDPAAPGLTLPQIAQGAELLSDLGAHQRPVTTSSPDAQAYFNQGLRLIYAFNHDEAARSFARATELDPKCASCFWGLALVLGPNYNVPMLADRFPVAWHAIESAIALANQTTPVEQALIGALARRYPGPVPKDPVQMAPYNLAYANAMRKVAASFHADDDVQTLFAEALMDLNPWKLWTPQGEPAPGTAETVSVLETVLGRNAQHPGANHYYIHAIESSADPGKALPSADRLAALLPAAGHIVHMPAHIYQRVGRYSDASKSNRDAAAVDMAYMGKAPPWGYYAMYLVHNYGFLAYSTSMEGKAAESLASARTAAKNFPPPMLEMMPGMDFFISEPLLVMVRFGNWDPILAEPRPDPKYQTLTALWLHAQGMALAATGKLDEASKVLTELRGLRDSIAPDVMATLNPAKDIVAVSAAILEASIAGRKNDPREHELWATAVALEDKLSYSEPADWFYPIRHYQGAALLRAKRYDEAETVYREDLRKNPENGWALFGLAEALTAKKKKKDAADARSRFEKAWAVADIKLTSTAF